MTVSIESPYLDAADAVWLRGNLHTHTTRSDGALSPQETIAAYAALGHDFLGLSDHNVPPDLEGLDARGMVLVPANEVTGSAGHILALGAGGGFQRGGEQQELIEAIAARGGLAVLCHPDWGTDFNHYHFEELAGFTGYAGIEIYNGSIEEDPGSPYATGKWDRLLAGGRRLWGLASDDAHRPPHQGRGTCVVRVRERSAEAVIEALRTGSFYASTGASIESLEVDGTCLRLAGPDAEVISVFGEGGRRLLRVEGRELVYDARECPGPYFRAEVLAPRGRMAWTQPLFLAGDEIEKRRALIEARPVLEVGRAGSAPELKGDLSDPAWKAAGLADALVDSSSGGAPPVRTGLRALLAGGTLFFGVLCEEPLPGRMKLSVTEDGNSNLWTDDGIEIFLDVAGRAERYFHVMANAAGYAYACEQGQLSAAPRFPRIRARAARVEAGYALEIAVPLAGLGLESAPEPGTRWGFNAVRNRRAEPGAFTFSFTGGSNHLPGRFGRLKF